MFGFSTGKSLLIMIFLFLESIVHSSTNMAHGVDDAAIPSSSVQKSLSSPQEIGSSDRQDILSLAHK